MYIAICMILFIIFTLINYNICYNIYTLSIYRSVVADPRGLGEETEAHRGDRYRLGHV